MKRSALSRSSGLQRSSLKRRHLTVVDEPGRDALYHLEGEPGSDVALCGYVFPGQTIEGPFVRGIHDCPECWRIAQNPRNCSTIGGRKAPPHHANGRGHDTEGVTSMQAKPTGRSGPKPRGHMKACDVCGDEFYLAPGKTNRRFCSQKCMGLSFRIERTCAVCGSAFWVSKGPRRKTCSPACAGKMKADAHRGKKRSPEDIRKVAQTTLRKNAEREAGLPLGPRRKKCARPGCQMSPTGQATKYCSPACHYKDRSRAGGGGRREQRYHRCASCETVFAWNGKGKGVFCSRECKNTRGGGPALDVELVEVVQLRGHRRRDFKDASESCRACGRPAAHNHHAVYRQHVTRANGDCWHPDDALALCVACHGAAHAHLLPLSVLRPENLAFAVDLLGTYAADYLRRYYFDDGDPRVAAMAARVAA